MLLTLACIVWYSTITLLVAVRGMSDVRRLLNNLREENERDDARATQSAAEKRDAE